MKLSLFALTLTLFTQNTFAATTTYKCTVDNSQGLTDTGPNMIEADNVLVPADGKPHFAKTNRPEYSVAVSISEIKDNAVFGDGYSNVEAYYEVDSGKNEITNVLPVLGGTIHTGEKIFQFQSVGKNFASGSATVENIFCQLQ